MLWWFAAGRCYHAVSDGITSTLQGEFHSNCEAEGIIDIIIADRTWVAQTLEACSETVVSCLTTHEGASLICLYFVIVELWSLLPEDKSQTGRYEVLTSGGISS